MPDGVLDHTASFRLASLREGRVLCALALLAAVLGGYFAALSYVHEALSHHVVIYLFPLFPVVTVAVFAAAFPLIVRSRSATWRLDTARAQVIFQPFWPAWPARPRVPCLVSVTPLSFLPSCATSSWVRLSSQAFEPADVRQLRARLSAPAPAAAA